ncbi:MAG: transposase [Planctomycetota bacterium]
MADVESDDGEGCSEPLLGHKRPDKQGTCDQKYSRTDPEASIYRRRGGEPKLAYKTHFMADAAKGVITAVSATTASVDDTAAVPELIEHHERHFGTPQRAGADHLYGSHDCLGYLQDKGIETVIPQRKGGNKYGRFDKSEFTYDSQRDVYHCPAAEVLSRRRRQRKDGKAFYSAARDVCQCCQLRSQCVGSKRPNAVRQVTRFDKPYVERAQAVCSSAHGKQLLAWFWPPSRLLYLHGRYNYARGELLK